MNCLKLFILLCLGLLTSAGLGCEETSARDSEAGIERSTDDGSGDRGEEPCAVFPENFEERGAFAYNDPSFGQIVQLTEFKGLAEGHNYADAIFDLSILKKYGAVFTPAAIDLSGRESSFDTCAYCIRFSEGVQMKNGKPFRTDRLFMPESGTLTFESLSNKDGDVHKFRLDAQMVEVTLGENSESIPVPDGCSFQLENLTRSVVIQK